MGWDRRAIEQAGFGKHYIRERWSIPWTIQSILQKGYMISLMGMYYTWRSLFLHVATVVMTYLKTLGPGVQQATGVRQYN